MNYTFVILLHVPWLSKLLFILFYVLVVVSQCCMVCHIGVQVIVMFVMFVSEVFVYVGVIVYDICDELGLYCFLRFTSVVVGDVSVDLILKY